MFTEEGPPKIAGESDESETVNFSVGSSSRSFDIPILAYHGSVSPGWKVTSLTAASKSASPAVSDLSELGTTLFFFQKKTRFFMLWPHKCYLYSLHVLVLFLINTTKTFTTSQAFQQCRNLRWLSQIKTYIGYKIVFEQEY